MCLETICFEVKFTRYKMNPFKANNPVALGAVSIVCDYSLSPLKTFLSSQIHPELLSHPRPLVLLLALSCARWPSWKWTLHSVRLHVTVPQHSADRVRPRWPAHQCLLLSSWNSTVSDGQTGVFTFSSDGDMWVFPPFGNCV